MDLLQITEIIKKVWLGRLLVWHSLRLIFGFLRGRRKINHHHWPSDSAKSAAQFCDCLRKETSNSWPFFYGCRKRLAPTSVNRLVPPSHQFSSKLRHCVAMGPAVVRGKNSATKKALLFLTVPRVVGLGQLSLGSLSFARRGTRAARLHAREVVAGGAS